MGINKVKDFLIKNLRLSKYFGDQDTPETKGGDQKSEIKDHKLVLREFINNFHWGKDLSNSQAKENLAHGIVELQNLSSSIKGNALLITDDGYCVTSYHCVEDLSEDTYIRLHDKTMYKVTKICAYNKSSDVAIIKADILAKPKAKLYRFVTDFNLGSRIPIVSLSRNDSQLKIKGGYINEPRIVKVTCGASSTETINQVPMEIDSKPGESGGIIATLNYEIYGLNNIGTINGDHKVKFGSCTFWFVVINLISKMVYGKDRTSRN